MNARYTTPGGNKRTGDGRGGNTGIIVLLVAIAILGLVLFGPL